MSASQELASDGNSSSPDSPFLLFKWHLLHLKDIIPPPYITSPRSEILSFGQ
jgi:hypothetical protein